ncbi:hypothetical protein PUMCH_000118 [Australozyma saopauloensis]|uniref:Dopa 4,5-dioxygenase n=1 Tax=Australozyma saopauloensis TaxID=291208 RepID=A0AAX4H2X1_9ASCO|nr:hypothetical protein PUMCH_000118 [[Candida] saopauloensis]
MASRIRSYDFHTYFNGSDKKETEFCLKFRDLVAAEFAEELASGKIHIEEPWNRPIGPHPINMWELDTAGVYDPALVGRLIGFYQLNHGKLSVLIHPRTSDGDLKDHTEYALWLGHKQRLMTDIFTD